MGLADDATNSLTSACKKSHLGLNSPQPLSESDKQLLKELRQLDRQLGERVRATRELFNNFGFADYKIEGAHGGLFPNANAPPKVVFEGRGFDTAIKIPTLRSEFPGNHGLKKDLPLEDAAGYLLLYYFSGLAIGKILGVALAFVAPAFRAIASQLLRVPGVLALVSASAAAYSAARSAAVIAFRWMLGRMGLGRAAIRRILLRAPKKNVRISRSKHPEAAKHIEDAQSAGKPSELTIYRPGAKQNRSDSLAGHAKVPGKQLDEYPPAMFKEGGKGASVRPISPKDNMGAGASMGNQIRTLPDGTKIRIIVVP